MLLFAVLSAGALATNLLAPECPGKTMGEGKIVIKYFSSPFCVACWAQKPVLEEFAADHGSEVRIEEYTAEFCGHAAAPHVVRGVPSFVINDTMILGGLPRESLEQVIA